MEQVARQSRGREVDLNWACVYNKMSCTGREFGCQGVRRAAGGRERGEYLPRPNTHLMCQHEANLSYLASFIYSTRGLRASFNNSHSRCALLLQGQNGTHQFSAPEWRRCTRRDLCARTYSSVRAQLFLSPPDMPQNKLM